MAIFITKEQSIKNVPIASEDIVIVPDNVNAEYALVLRKMQGDGNHLKKVTI